VWLDGLFVPFKEDEFIGAFACKGCVENVIPTLLWSKTLKRIDNVYDIVLNMIITLNYILKKGAYWIYLVQDKY
jgi:hypothetical protein